MSYHYIESRLLYRYIRVKLKGHNNNVLIRTDLETAHNCTHDNIALTAAICGKTPEPSPMTRSFHNSAGLHILARENATGAMTRSSALLMPPPKEGSKSPSYDRFLEICNFTLHATRRTPHGASRLVQTMPAWLGENPTCSVPA